MHVEGNKNMNKWHLQLALCKTVKEQNKRKWPILHVVLLGKLFLLHKTTYNIAI